MKMRFRISALSDVGLVRKNNEDNLFIPTKPIKNMADAYYKISADFSTDKAYICVCDGMGGHSSGEVASYMVANKLPSTGGIIRSFEDVFEYSSGNLWYIWLILPVFVLVCIAASIILLRSVSKDSR